MNLIWARVDQKLIHGQIVVAWVPHLAIDAIVVSDHDTAEDLWVQKVMMMGLPPEVSVTRFTSPANLSAALSDGDLFGKRVMVIFKDLGGVSTALEAGLPLKYLNLGNQASRPLGQDVRLTENFYASEDELELLASWQAKGLEVILQTVPAEKAKKLTPGPRK